MQTMMRGCALGLLALAGLLPGGMAPPVAAEPVAVFSAQEYLQLDWARTLVTYRIECKPGQAKADMLRLVDAAGVEQPCQLWQVAAHPDGSLASARVSFFAELKKGGTFSYSLLPEKPAAAAPSCTAGNDGNFLTLENGTVAYRMPKTGEFTFAQPLTFGSDQMAMVKLYGNQVENGIAPGPFQGVKLADGRWAGGSYFWAAQPEDAPKVTGYSCTVTERGPLFLDAQIYYTFTNGGWYRVTVRLLAGDAAARIDEQFDMKSIGSGFDWRVVTSFSRGWEAGGWKPDYAYWYVAGARIPGRDANLDQAMTAAGLTGKIGEGNEFGNTKLNYDKPFDIPFTVAVRYPWATCVQYLGLVDSKAVTPEAAQAGTAPFLGVIPIHVGNWRGDQQGFRNTLFITHQGDDVDINWPLRAEPHPNTLLHTGEYDPALPLTYVRRQWALLAGPAQYYTGLHTFRVNEGFVNLDNYKDWILEWPEDPTVTFPRLVSNRQDIERLAATLDAQPGADILRKFLYFKEDATRRNQLFDGLTAISEWSGPLGQANRNLVAGDPALAPWISPYRQSQMAGWVGNADELLSSKELPAEQRKRLRTYLAALCYVLSSPDFNPRGSLDHLGNPNMPMNRFMALPFTASLIPDHPRAKEWLDVSADYLRYKLAMNTAPGSAWSELISYYMASAPHTIQAATVLGQSGRLDASTARLAAEVATFPLYLMTPKDPRFNARFIPNWGHEGSDIAPQWLLAAGLMRSLDPGLAHDLAWAWDQLGRPMENHHDAGFSERAIVHADLLNDLKPGYVPARFTSRWLPGFGAVLRAHSDDPNETYLSYRQGYMVSHSDANQGDFMLCAKGAPLVALSLFQYAFSGNSDSPYAKFHDAFGWHSNVRFGDKTKAGGGWNASSLIHAHSFSSSVDYLRGHADYGPQRWTRQILFLKGKAAAGPNYFLFRDSFHNPGGDEAQLQQKWWYLRTLGRKEQVQTSATGLQYTSEFGPRLNAHFLQPAAVQAETRDVTQTGPVYNRAAINWGKVHSPDATTFSSSISVEETLSVTAFGPLAPGQDALVALYPQGATETAPTYEALADGAARITTAEGVDYVFVHRRPMTFTQGDISFTGTAGAVRIYPTEVHLVIAEGPGEISYQGMTLKSAVPVTKVIPRQEIRKQIITVPAEKSPVTFTLDPKQGALVEVQPGVKKQTLANGFAYAFDSPVPVTFAADDITFTGTHGGVVVDTAQKTTRLVLLQGEKIASGSLQAWGCDGPFDLTFYADHITGHSAGLGRFLYVTTPPGLDRLPMLVLDGQTYAPGTAGRTLVVPLMPGEHRFDLRALPQPPIWRNWQAW